MWISPVPRHGSGSAPVEAALGKTLDDTTLVAIAAGVDARTADADLHQEGASLVAVANSAGVVIYPVDEVYKIPGMKRIYGITDQARALPLFRVYRVPKMKRIYGGH
jgi:hypothetical protein